MKPVATINTKRNDSETEPKLVKIAPAYSFLFLTSSLLLSAFAFGQSGDSKVWKLPIARLTVKTVDESGAAVSDVRVGFAFLDPVTRHPSPIEGLTDKRGLFSGQGGCDGSFGGMVQKSGYYNGGYPFTPYREAKDGKWQPWDVTYTSLMRKIEKPISMYARIAVVTVPIQGKPCGYDLKQGDWVSPWGKGLVADFVFAVESRYTNYNAFDASMKLAFSNPLDGIQPASLPAEYAHSEFIWHRQAPETGFLPGYDLEHGMPAKHYQIPSAPSVRDFRDVEKQKFYFRVRTVEKDGKIVSALYGKLAAGLEILIPNQQEVRIVLNYYLNPTPLDRNMEFDMKQNLFTNLTVLERPRRF